MSDWVDVRIQETGKLLFRYDPQNEVVQIGSRRQVHEVYLAEYRNVHNDNSSNSLTFNAEGARIDTGTSSVQS